VAREQLVDIAAGVAARRDLDVLELAVLLQRQRALDRGVRGAHDAGELVLVELLDPEVRRQLGVRRVIEHADRQIDGAVAQEGRRLGGARHHVERHARGLAREAIEVGTEHGDQVVAGVDPERALERVHVLDRRRREHLARLADDRLDPAAQAVGARRRDHALPGADEERIADLRAQPRQRVAHRGRRQPDPGRRARDVLLLKQRIERDQQVEVGLFHGVQGYCSPRCIARGQPGT
jgi:hypothetical protein